MRLRSACFSAFCRCTGNSEPGRVGLTVPRRVGDAVIRNRTKRRLRELIRRHWDELPDGCEVVLHIHRPLRGMEDGGLEAELRRIFREAVRRLRL